MGTDIYVLALQQTVRVLECVTLVIISHIDQLGVRNAGPAFKVWTSSPKPPIGEPQKESAKAQASFRKLE
jgi:hypothetical protein